MNDKDELRELWGSQSSAHSSTAADIVRMVEKRLRDFDRLVAVRNWIEFLAAAAVAIFFGWTSAHAANHMIRIGSLVVAGGAAWIVFYLRRYGNSAAPLDANRKLIDYTRVLIEHYEHQIRLLTSVKYWYLAPIYAGMLIMSVGQLQLKTKTSALGWRDFSGLMIFTVVIAAIWWVNEVSAVGRLKKERARLLVLLSEEERMGEENELAQSNSPGD